MEHDNIRLAPGRYVVAVSGGIDSMVLLEMLSSQAADVTVIVAHFDHGIRPDSAEDALFVGQAAAQYGYGFETIREELGAGASEELARIRRYGFLRHVAKTYQATLVTAHHADDVVETIAINLTRGTGWRGLAVLDSPDIVRPLLHLTKRQLQIYADTHDVIWREDSTNMSDVYMRNRLRQRLDAVEKSVKAAVRERWQAQIKLKRAIDSETALFFHEDGVYERALFIQIDQIVALELLRAACLESVQRSLTRPQLERALLAIKTARPKAMFQAGSGVTLQFTKQTFSILRSEKMVS